jgi:hypothetical protein
MCIGSRAGRRHGVKEAFHYWPEAKKAFDSNGPHRRNATFDMGLPQAYVENGQMTVIRTSCFWEETS